MYRKIDAAMWADRKFRELSPPGPCGQFLWVYLLTGRHGSCIPGVVIARPDELAAYLGWHRDAFGDAFDDAFQEVVAKGMARVTEESRKAGLIWLPRGPRYNPPTSPNMVRSWAKAWPLVPECDLKEAIFRELNAFVKGMSKAFRDAFDDAFRDAFRDAFAIQEAGNRKQETGSRVHTCPGSASAAPDGCDPPEGGSPQLPGESSPPGQPGPEPPLSPPGKPKGKRKPKPERPPPSAEALKLADYLRTLLLRAKPDHRIGKRKWGDSDAQRNSWGRELDLMHTADGREWRRSAELVRWVFTEQRGDARFVVESAAALRTKWDRLDSASKNPRTDGYTAAELAAMADAMEAEDERKGSDAGDGSAEGLLSAADGDGRHSGGLFAGFGRPRG